MEKRILKSEKAGKFTPAMVKVMAAITGRKENGFRPFLQYVHYNATEKRLEATEGRCLVTVDAGDFMPEPEREGFFTVADGLLIESDYTAKYPNFNNVIPSSSKMKNKASISGFEKRKPEERAIRIAVLTENVFNIGEKSILSVFGFCDFTTIEWNNPGQAVKMYNGRSMAVVMPMADCLGCFHIINDEEEAAPAEKAI